MREFKFSDVVRSKEFPERGAGIVFWFKDNGVFVGVCHKHPFHAGHSLSDNRGVPRCKHGHGWWYPQEDLDLVSCAAEKAREFKVGDVVKGKSHMGVTFDRAEITDINLAAPAPYRVQNIENPSNSAFSQWSRYCAKDLQLISSVLERKLLFKIGDTVSGADTEKALREGWVLGIKRHPNAVRYFRKNLFYKDGSLADFDRWYLYNKKTDYVLIQHRAASSEIPSPKSFSVGDVVEFVAHDKHSQAQGWHCGNRGKVLGTADQEGRILVDRDRDGVVFVMNPDCFRFAASETSGWRPPAVPSPSPEEILSKVYKPLPQGAEMELKELKKPANELERKGCAEAREETVKAAVAAQKKAYLRGMDEWVAKETAVRALRSEADTLQKEVDALAEKLEITDEEKTQIFG